MSHDSRNSGYRLILNDDGSNFLYLWDDLGVDDLRAYLSRFANTQVDMVCYCVAFGGYVCYYNTDVAERLCTGFAFTDRLRARRCAHNLRRLTEEGGDYIGAVFGILHELGMPAVASIRINDAHMSSDAPGPVAGRFWLNHPQWRLGESYGYYGSCLSYENPGVRQYLRRLVREVVEKFPDLAGIELDGMRSPFFFKEGEGKAKSGLMTELIQQIRGDLNEAAKSRGRDQYLLRVNVPRSPRLALEVGMDVAEWDRQGIVDALSPGCYGTDFQLPMEDWKDTLRNGTPVYAYLNCGRVGSQYHSLEQYRAAAANAYASGADGIYLFNVPCLDELSGLLLRPIDQPPVPVPDFAAQCWHPDLTKARRALNELGDPEGLAHRNKHFLFYTQPPPYRHYVPEQASLDRTSPQSAELAFRCYEDFGRAAEIRLELKATPVTIRDELGLKLNGHAIASEQIRRLHAPGGRDARIHGTPLEPYSLYTIELQPDLMLLGENRLEVMLTAQEPDLFGEIEIREMELFVEYPDAEAS